MFKKNEDHLQQRMFSAIASLPEAAQKRLAKSWAPVFYREFFCRIDESVFQDLYSNKKSRPNTPVNILLGFETLKSGFGWSDEELYDHFLFDLQVRYSLGLHEVDEGYFDLRTVYNFRSALSTYEKETGCNLLKEATRKITDGQIEQLKLKTGLQRMDSTQIQSNIRHMSRIQLLVELIQRMYRILSLPDRTTYAESFAEYIKEDSLHYCYRIKRDETLSRLERIGAAMAILLDVLHDGYQGTDEYHNLQRAFGEHFRREDDRTLTIKEGKELSGKTLQSPDDTEATYRKKRNESAKGYVTNITETCDHENEVQLITETSVAPNTTDDQVLFEQDLAYLKERTDIQEIWTDGGYVGETAAQAADTHDVNHRVTAVKGRAREEGQLGLDDFAITKDAEGNPETIMCPQGENGTLETGKSPDRYSAGFDATKCSTCPLQDICPTKKLKRKPLRILRFSQSDLRSAAQRRQVQTQGKEGNIRAAVESTVRSVIHPFGGHLCKMPVRGRFRIENMIILSAMMVNIRRIGTYFMNHSILNPSNKLLVRTTSRILRILEGFYSYLASIFSLPIRIF